MKSTPLSFLIVCTALCGCPFSTACMEHNQKESAVEEPPKIPLEIKGIDDRFRLYVNIAKATYRLKNKSLRKTVTVYWLEYTEPETKVQRRIWQQVRQGDDRESPDNYMKRGFIWGQPDKTVALTFFNGWAVQFYELDLKKAITPFRFDDAGEFVIATERVPDIINFSYCFNLLHIFRAKYGAEEGARRLWFRDRDVWFKQVTRQKTGWEIVVSIQHPKKGQAAEGNKSMSVDEYVFALPKGDKAWKLVNDAPKKEPEGSKRD